MRVYYDCYLCRNKSQIEAIDLATNDESIKDDILKKIVPMWSESYSKGPEPNPNILNARAHRMIKKMSGNDDPFKQFKEDSTRIANKIISNLNVENHSLEELVKLAILGNFLDIVVLGADFNYLDHIDENSQKGLAINHIDKLHEDIKKHSKVLYLVDNVGEISFDKLLIEKLIDLGLEVTVAGKSAPIGNDATEEDLIDIGLDKIANTTHIGTDSGGFIYEEASPEFQKFFDESDFIISKGLGNYEGLTELDLKGKDVFILLCAKCRPVSLNLDVKLYDNVLKKL
ncbi:MAG: ARMT1-like domain-containing protein [Methanobrevibacter sp.]|jgi:uncharacterized protein with ATP-grasp and redox domains|nr:ARMT1-like domain-containing protein [Candidatus Methanovirga meridionalis]